MSPSELARPLALLQDLSGAFHRSIVSKDRCVDDCNGFATALVLRAMRHYSAAPELEALRQRALDFLESCASPQLPGAFGFWPLSQRPAWACRVPADIDDTAVINLEPAIHGRRSLIDVQRVFYEVLLPNLLVDVDPYGPPWMIPLVFPTWLAPDSQHRPNPVDCCVNTNVLALMAYAGLT